VRKGDKSNFQAGYDFQLSLTEYDAAGRAYKSIDNLGRENWTFYDDAGRTVKTIQNYVAGSLDGNGLPVETATECDITVSFRQA
jgi:hypothetical protein